MTFPVTILPMPLKELRYEFILMHLLNTLPVVLRSVSWGRNSLRFKTAVVVIGGALIPKAQPGSCGTERCQGCLVSAEDISEALNRWHVSPLVEGVVRTFPLMSAHSRKGFPDLMCNILQ